MMLKTKLPAIPTKLLKLSLLGASLLVLAAQTAQAETLRGLEVSGSGAAPGSTILIASDSLKTVTLKADKSGNFTVPGFAFPEGGNFNLRISLASENSARQAPIKNDLIYNISPGGSVVLEGTGTKAASIVLNSGATKSKSAVANDQGYFRVSGYLDTSSTPNAVDTTILTSIINVQEKCCPRSFEVLKPLSIKIISSTMTMPDKESALDPDLIEGTVVKTAVVESEPLAFASIDSSWIDTLKDVSFHFLSTLMLQTRMIGGFIDAKAHLDSQRVLQALNARTVRDYVPGEMLCRFGTLSRNLSSADSSAQATKVALNEVFLDRETQRRQTMTAGGPSAGAYARTWRFKLKYCDLYDENNAFGKLCGTTVPDVDINKDVDYTRTVDLPLTIPVNFLSPPSAPEAMVNQDVLAIAANLFATEPFNKFNRGDLDREMALGADDVQNQRAVAAARGLVRNSFTALVSMKAQSRDAGAANNLVTVLEQLGLSNANAKRMLGDKPSYYAQMEILTKKIYQDPAFYAELYDKPANVMRQRTAMKAIGLQQDFDLLTMMQRREMLLSALLELKIRNRAEE